MNPWLRRKIVALVLFATACGHAKLASEMSSDPSQAPSNSIRLGQGFDSIGGQAYSDDKSYCVDRTATTTLGGSPGENLSIYVDTVTSQDEVDLAVSSSQSFGASGEEANVFSASAGYSDDRKVSSIYRSSYSYVFVHVKKTFAAEVMTDFRPSTDSLDYFKQRPKEFFGKCGDRFVSGVQKGAEVIAFLRCETHSQEEKESIDRSVKAQAGFKALSASGSVEDTLTSVRQATGNKCVVTVGAQGGSGSYDVRNADGLVSSALAYVTSATQSTGSALEFETMPYSSLLSTDFASNVLDKIDLTLTAQRQFVSAKKSQIKDMTTLIADLPDGSAAIDVALSNINSLAGVIGKCVEDIYDSAACKDPQNAHLRPGVGLHP